MEVWEIIWIGIILITFSIAMSKFIQFMINKNKAGSKQCIEKI